MIKIAPSILASDYANLGQQVGSLSDWGADWVHFDVMDGHFVPNLTFGPGVLKAVRPYTKLPIDVHLMVTDPSFWIPLYADAGADVITFHMEANAPDPAALLDDIHARGCKAGVVLRPATPVEACYPVLEACDLVLLMSVNPGFGGQKFHPETPERVRQLRRELTARGLETDIEIDGGVNPETAKRCIDAGATILVAGSSVFRADDPGAMIATLRG